MLSLNLLGRYQQLSLHQGHQAATPAQVFLSEERELFVRFCLVTRDFFVIFHLTATTLLARCCTDFLNLREAINGKKPHENCTKIQNLPPKNDHFYTKDYHFP